jgi:phospholipid-transporting ATPase
MTQFWFSFCNLSSGQTLYESWMITLYNVIFTFIPPIMIGVTDQHLTARELDAHPALYRLGPLRFFFNVGAFWGTTANALFHSLLLFGSAYLLVHNGTGGELLLSNGIPAGHWFLGAVIYVAVLVTVLGKAALLLTHWTWLAFLTLPGSLIAWFFFFPFYDHIFAAHTPIAQEIRGLSGPLLTAPIFWLFVVAVPVMCLLRDLLWKYARRQQFPLPHHIIQTHARLHRPPPFQPPPSDTLRAAKSRLQRRLQRQLGALPSKSRGYAFSQSEKQATLVSLYDRMA